MSERQMTDDELLAAGRPEDVIEAINDGLGRAEESVARLEQKLAEMEADHDAMKQIASIMDGAEWDADVTGAIAEVVRETGRRLRSPDEFDQEAGR